MNLILDLEEERQHSNLSCQLSGGAKAVRNKLFVAFVFLLLPAAAAWGQNAREWYNRGLKSSLAHKKIEHFTKAVQLNPNLVEAYEQRAVHYYFQGRLDQAIQDYTSILNLKPHAANAYLMRGLACLKKAHGEGLMPEINRLGLHIGKFGVPESEELLLTAIEDFSRAIDLDPRLASAYAYRAEVYRIRGMTDESMRDCNRAIELRGNPQSTARAYAIRAGIYRQLHQDKRSEADLRNSVALDPYTPDYPPLHVPLISQNAPTNANLKAVGRLGLFGILVLAFVVVFRLSLKPPDK